MVVRFVAYNIYGMGGTVRTVANTANYLADNGYKVEIISLRKTSNKPLFNLNKNIKLYPLIDITKSRRVESSRKEYVKKILSNIPGVIFDKNEDLYHMTNLLMDIKLYRKLKRIKNGVLITTIPSLNVLSSRCVNENVIKIGQEHRTYEVHNKSIQKKIRKYYRDLDAIACLTNKDTENYKRIIGTDTRIEKIENATDIQYQTSTLKNKVIISAGRFSEEKGFDLLIESFEKAINRSRDKSWILKIYGNGPLKLKYQNIIDEKGLRDKIKILPTSSTLVDEIKESSIYALSSRSESFGMVIIESMSVGVPCISFKCDGPKEVIEDGKFGVLVENENTDEFSEKLVGLMNDFDKRKELGENAKINTEKYSIGNIGEKWIRLMKELKKSKDKK